MTVREVDFGVSVSVWELSHTFQGSAPVLGPLSFEIAPNELVVILGPSGSGKTTLLRLLSGLAFPTTGAIRINQSTPDEMRRTGQIGMAFQEPALFPWRTVTDNIRLPLQIQRKVDSEIVDHLMKMVHLDGSGTLLPSQLSGGMAQRVAVARALAVRPKLLLLDEPFGALDWFLRRQVITNFAEVWSEHRPTTVLVTHEIREAAFLADRIIGLSQPPGRIAWDMNTNLPRPRPKETFSDHGFRQLCDEIEARNDRSYA
jgi:NitT/TauT family transport system ATP-binding protein